MNTTFQLTLAIIKPHALKIPLALQGIRKIIVSNRFFVVRSKMMKMTEAIAEDFYSEHKEKFFYPRLITSMSCGPSQMLILTKEKAISEWRALMGPTKVFKAIFTHQETIRGMYGITDTRNITHGSDSEESTRRELQIVYPEFDVDEWYRHDEPHYRNYNVTWNAKKFVHVVHCD